MSEQEKPGVPLAAPVPVPVAVRRAPQAAVPTAPVEPRFRTAHGTVTAEPFGWMTDRSDLRLHTYLTAEREHYQAAVSGLAGLRSLLGAEFAARLPTEEAAVPWRCGPYTYVEQTRAGSEFPQLGRRRNGSDAGFEVVLDGGTAAAAPATQAGAGSYFRFGVCEPSPDGRLIAYSVDFTGDEVYELRFRDAASGRDRPDRIARSYYGCAWSADSSAFFYVVHDTSFRPCRVMRHVIGMPQAADKIVFAEPDARYHVTVGATRSGDWIVISADARDTNEQWIVPAARHDAAPRLVERRRRGVEYFTEHLGGPAAGGAGPGRFAILTNDGAPEYRVVTAPVEAPGRGNWRELVPGHPDIRFHRLDVIGGYLVLSCRSRGDPFLRIVRPDGSHHDQHPETPAGFIEAAVRGSYDAADVVVSTQSLVAPKWWWSVDLHTGKRTPLRATRAPGYDEAAYVTRRLWAPAPDGEHVPVTIAYRRGLRPDGSAPCLLYGYGAYESCADPRFSATLPSLLDRGYVYAIGHVRGGGELGRHWWQDGRLAAKRNTFTDFVAVRDHLVRAGWAAPGRVACRGLSAGGLTVAVAYTFWPDRWAGVIAEAPAVDLLNQMLDPAVPLTVNEYDEWGDPADEPQFRLMRSYTPAENVTDVPRPPLLATGILHDPRVMISEPAKWVAALRAADTCGNRILLRAELGPSAHRGPAGRSASLAYEAELLAWVISLTGRPAPRLRGDPSGRGGPVIGVIQWPG
ncbi:MAG TPA: prolyl oligopeptidase family serine peptidase [Streptosporangiaceae bacterium]|nr:prolyl oligopeptidase family serine peptidase [Streptosporangiaceae bacterium]